MAANFSCNGTLDLRPTIIKTNVYDSAVIQIYTDNFSRLSREAASALFRQRCVPARLSRRKRPQRALLFPALRTSHPLGHVIELRIPTAQPSERVRLGGAFMPASCAPEKQRELTKLVAQLLDSKFAWHAANCSGTAPARPSSTRDSRTLYEYSSLAGPFWLLPSPPLRRPFAIGGSTLLP